MYDWVHCEHPLLDPEHRDMVFQTKNLLCLMEQYLITEDGYLIRHKQTWEVVPEEERPYYGTPNWDKGGLFRARGMFRTSNIEEIVIAYHGDVWLLKHLDEPIEYRVRFTNGKVESVERIRAGE